MQLFKRRCIVLTDEHGKVYVVDGQVHREDGPAVECNNGNKAWFLNGQEVSKETHELNTRYKTVMLDDNKPTFSLWDTMRRVLGGGD
jgi:hypothetical protein